MMTALIMLLGTFTPVMAASVYYVGNRRQASGAQGHRRGALRRLGAGWSK